jgi:hypothetical protein
MKTNRVPSIVKPALIALIACALGSPLAFAQATRTWVSGVGNDANPCSLTAPCKTFAGAITKTFINGEIDVLDPGGFGTVNITKSMTIDGSGGPHASTLASGTTGVIINIATGNANDPTRTVTLRNLSINGTGASGAVGTRTGINGVRIDNADEVNIENCVIFNFSQLGVKIAPGTTCKVNIKNCIIRDCNLGAVEATGTSAATEANVTIANSTLSTSQFGYKGNNFTTATLKDCVVFRNTANGVLANSTGSAAILHVNHCVISDNLLIGVKSVGANARVTIGNNSIVHNQTGIGGGGPLLSFKNNLFDDNTPGGDGVATGTIDPK